MAGSRISRCGFGVQRIGEESSSLPSTGNWIRSVSSDERPVIGQGSMTTADGMENRLPRLEKFCHEDTNSLQLSWSSMNP